MANEIERKFLVVGDAWRQSGAGVEFQQGYLSSVKERVVRVRLEGDRAALTIKGLTTGITRAEFEYAIPSVDARALLVLCEQPLIQKTRYRLRSGDAAWEIDEFHGDNEGLVVAEIELGSADQPFDRPPWLGREVSDDPRYFNANLVRHPYRLWADEERRPS